MRSAFALISVIALAAAGAALAQDDDGRIQIDPPMTRGQLDANSPIVTQGVEPGPAHPPEVIQPVFMGEITLNGVRIGAVDTEALADFYKRAFGLQEVQRIPVGAAPEIMLNFGETVEAAIANTNGDIVIMPDDAAPGGLAHVIFDVKDAASVAEAVEAHGGAITRGAMEFGDTGIIIAMVADPVGNPIELIQWPEEAAQ